MHRLSMNQMTTFRWSFLEDVLAYQKQGYRAIGVWRRKLADFGEAKGIELLQDAGLNVSHLLWAGGFTGSDGRSFKESVADAIEAIHLADAMNAGCLTVCTGGKNNHIAPHMRRLVLGAIDKLLPVAEIHNVTLAIEPMHVSYAQDWTVLNDLEHASEILNRYDSSCLKLAIDTYHLGRCRTSLSLLPELIDQVAIVQLADSHSTPSMDQERCHLGEGNVPLQEIVQCLIQHGYKGYYDIELLGTEAEEQNYEKLLATCQHKALALLEQAGKMTAA